MENVLVPKYQFGQEVAYVDDYREGLLYGIITGIDCFLKQDFEYGFSYRVKGYAKDGLRITTDFIDEDNIKDNFLQEARDQFLKHVGTYTNLQGFPKQDLDEFIELRNRVKKANLFVFRYTI